MALNQLKTKSQRGYKNLCFLSRNPIKVFAKDYGILYPDSVCWHQPSLSIQENFGCWIILFKNEKNE
jgi:hypothetical protein